MKTDFSALWKILLLSVPTDFKSLTGNDSWKFSIKRFWMRKMMKNKIEIKANSLPYLQEILNYQNKNSCISNIYITDTVQFMLMVIEIIFYVDGFSWGIFFDVFTFIFNAEHDDVENLKTRTKFKHFFHLLLILVYLLCWNIVKDFFRYRRWYLPLYTYRN